MCASTAFKAWEPPPADLVDRAVGSFLGVAVGDALGATVTLPDGTELTAPAVPVGDPKDGGTVADIVQYVTVLTTKSAVSRDLTNTIVGSRGIGNADGYAVLARCRDGKGRELLAEFLIKFAL